MPQRTPKGHGTAKRRLKRFLRSGRELAARPLHRIRRGRGVECGDPALRDAPSGFLGDCHRRAPTSTLPAPPVAAPVLSRSGDRGVDGRAARRRGDARPGIPAAPIRRGSAFRFIRIRRVCGPDVDIEAVSPSVCVGMRVVDTPIEADSLAVRSGVPDVVDMDARRSVAAFA